MTTQTNHDVIVIGAGFSGMYLVRRLRDEMGLDVRVFERGSDVGGTWFWNRYPGARCDVESQLYSYSVDSDLQQAWVWTERYAAQPEILSYLNHVADRWDVRRSIQFDTDIVRAAFDETNSAWTVSTANGDTATAQFIITAVGCLSVPSVPDISGLADFHGDVYHTGSWPHDGVDFKGKRVAVVGTGSSGIQAIPVIAEQAETLTVFQRTPTYAVPARNRPLSEIERRVTKSSYPTLRQAARYSRIGTITEMPLGPSHTVQPEVLDTELERRWWQGGVSIPGTLSDAIISKAANERIAEFVRAKIHDTVTDPELARLLVPNTHPIGSKRIVLDTDYFETYNRPNVSLVSIRETPIERVTEAGLVVDGREHEFDAIVLATGYDAMTGALNRMHIEGRAGLPLSEAWSEGPKTYLGVAVHGFPNLFTVTGPGSPSVISNVVVSIEQHVDWITEYISYIRGEGIAEVEAQLDAQELWVEHVRTVAARTLLPKTASWYMGANIPGKPRVFMPYLGGVGVYRRRCEQEVASGYAGFGHHSKRAVDARRITEKEIV